MKKIYKILLIILSILIFIVIVYFLSKPRKMNQFTFPDTVVVNNYTEFEIDTVVKVLVNKIFEQDSVEINIFYIEKEMVFDDIVVMAHIHPAVYSDRVYVLFIDKSLRFLNVVLSHEFVHFDQYIKKELELNKELRVAIYKGDTISFDTPYDLRPYEKDAYRRQGQVAKELNDLLYKKN